MEEKIKMKQTLNTLNSMGIVVREYRRGNKKWKIQRNWQHRVHKTKKNETKTQHYTLSKRKINNRTKLKVKDKTKVQNLVKHKFEQISGEKSGSPKG